MDSNSKNTNGRNPFVKLPSDSVYALYRTMRQAEQEKQEQDPDAEVTSSGFILLSKEQGDGGSYSLMATAFGTEENIMTSLSLFIINNIKEHAGPSKEKSEIILFEKVL